MAEFAEEKRKITHYNQEAEEYLQQLKVFDVFSNLCQQLCIHKPKNAIEFMISQLEADLRTQLRKLLTL